MNCNYDVDSGVFNRFFEIMCYDFEFDWFQ